MGFFNCSPETSRDDVPVSIEIELVDIDNLLRMAEQDQRVETILENFRTQVQSLQQQASGAGGMRPEDWNIVKQDALRASTALKEFGYVVESSLIENLD